MYKYSAKVLFRIKTLILGMGNRSQLNQKVFEAFPSIKTERLVLRELQEKDAEAILQMRDHIRFNEFIPRPALSGREEARVLARVVLIHFLLMEW